MRSLSQTLALVGAGLALSMSFQSEASAQSFEPSSSFGVWDRGNTFDPNEYPFLKGFACDQTWDEIEKSPGVFDWSELDKTMARAMKYGRNVYLAINVGPDSPNWIYAHGVPKVKCAGEAKEHDKWTGYPFYTDSKYKEFYGRLIQEFAKKVHSYSKEQQERIAFVQVKTGCTGDECPYKGDATDHKYNLTTGSQEWSDFRIWAFGVYNEAFQKDPNGRPIPLMFNNVSPDDESDEGDKADKKKSQSGGKFTKEWKWVTDNVSHGYGIKIAGSGRGHHLEGELQKIETWQPRLIGNPTPLLFARSEMDQTWTKSMYAPNIPMSFYWGAITGLQAGQSIWDISKGALEGCEKYGFDYSFKFFDRYAGQTNPTTASAAFCALHKGLDAADTKAFPESKYGPADRKNVDRMLKICSDFSKHGAAIDDKNGLLLGQVRQRDTQTGFNDVGWNIWSENYGRFLNQIDPDGTSIPLWRIGGPITKSSSIYDRFARGFEHSSGKNAMYFKLDDGFSGKPGPKEMTVTVVWYDGVAGSTWKLEYDGGASAMKTALSITGTGDKQWHHEVATVEDAVFKGGGLHGSDLALVNTDDKDDVFSIIEVFHGKPDVADDVAPTAGPSGDSPEGKGGDKKNGKKSGKKSGKSK